MENFELHFIVIIALSFLLPFITVWTIKEYLIKRTFSQLFFVGSFLLIISIPLTGKKEEVSLEKRALTSFPKMRITNVWKFFFEFQDYFNDRFAYRNKSVEFISKFRLDLFKVSNMPHMVEVGKNGWLFTSKEVQIKNIATPFTKEQLDTVEMNLEIITRYLDAHNIKFYYSMIPAKERIYPEYMSELLQYRMRFSKYDQLYERLSKNPRIRSVDVKDVLIAGKPVYDTYSSIDTHWNHFGCFLAYSKIINRIKKDFPEIEPSVLSDYIIDTLRTDDGDLQFLLGFRNKFFYDNYRLFHKSGIIPLAVDSTYPDVPASWNYEVRTMSNTKNKLKLVLVRDSFSEYLKFFIARDFEKSELIWTPYVPIGKIISIKPDVVLQEIGEPLINTALTAPNEILADTAFMNQNFPGYLK